MANQASTEDLLDFSQPWEFSDVVLVVEEERFHVHRSILGIWSPVFSRMFTAEFKENTAEEVPLPGKKSSEIKEMLLVIYPTCGEPIDKNNYAFLLELAEEYMMTKLTKKCEIYLMHCLEEPVQRSFSLSPRSLHCLDLLHIAQTYELESLQAACINRAKSMSLNELKRHEMYSNISLPNYRAIMEGKVEKTERELRDKGHEVSRFKSESERIKSWHKSRASNALKELENIISILVFLVCKSENYDRPEGIDAKLGCIQRSGGDFKNLYGPLTVLCNQLRSLAC